MVRSSLRNVLWPGFGFALLLGLVVHVSLTAGASPEAALHGSTLAYLRALRDGDTDRVAALRADGDPAPEVQRLQRFHGRSFFVVQQALFDAGREGRVLVAWLGPGGAPLEAEEEIWRLGAGDTWLFVGLGDVVGHANR